MDFTIEKRIKNKNKFLNIKNSNRKNFYQLFKKTLIGEGSEAKVYKAKYSKEDFYIIIKIVKLAKLDKGKVNLLDYTLDQYLKLRDSSIIFKDHPSLIELISNKLISLLIEQKICPNYSLNYFTSATKSSSQKIKTLYYYNEYVNYGDLHKLMNSSLKFSDSILFNILFQIMIALIGMQKYFNMIHSDLHFNNILIQIVKPGGYWTYILEGKKYYLPNMGFVILLHDFGFSLIPNKLYLTWYHKKLSSVNYKFHDIVNVIENFLKYQLPTVFKKIITSCFEKELKNSKYGRSLTEKFYKIFYKLNCKDISIENVYNKIPINSYQIEEYNLDKKFDKTKIPSNYKMFVV